MAALDRPLHVAAKGGLLRHARPRSDLVTTAAAYIPIALILYGDVVRQARLLVLGLLLFGFSLALVYHLLNGIRHLLWDAGWGFEIPEVYKSGYAVAALTVVFTVLIWWAALGGNA